MKKAKTRKKRRPAKKEQNLLSSVAESLGTTLGVIAAKAGAARSSLRSHKTSRRRRVKTKS